MKTSLVTISFTRLREDLSIPASKTFCNEATEAVGSPTFSKGLSLITILLACRRSSFRRDNPTLSCFGASMRWSALRWERITLGTPYAGSAGIPACNEREARKT
jgi:hypothetical protein